MQNIINALACFVAGIQISDIAFNQREIFVRKKSFNIFVVAGREIVKTSDFVSRIEKILTEVWANESGSRETACHVSRDDKSAGD